MNRFFSKLNLADIKIKAEGNSFPPDADDQIEEEPAVEFEPVVEIEEQPVAVIDEYEAVAEQPLAVDDVYETVAEQPIVVEVEETTIISDGYDTYVAETTYEYTASNGHVTSEDIVIGLGEVLKVSARSRPSAVAGAIAGVVREAGKAEVQAIGAGATNQAIKAVAIARDYLRESGIEAICIPAFIDVTIENEDRTAIRLVVEPR